MPTFLVVKVVEGKIVSVHLEALGVVLITPTM